jgi:hypothetical protein
MRKFLLVAVSAAGLALQGCATAPASKSCDANADTASRDPTNVVFTATGAGGSQSLGSGSNVNGPLASGIGVSDCYAKRTIPWALPPDNPGK